jgi:hypothetical protein
VTAGIVVAAVDPRVEGVVGIDVAVEVEIIPFNKKVDVG